MSLNDLMAAHRQIIKGLRSLPETVDVPEGEGDTTKEVYLSENVRADVKALKEYWLFVQEHMNKNVVALVGMVNAGKSAVGNLLMDGRESQYFEEGPVRQTDSVSQVNWEASRLLVDLPGLGSTLAPHDDAVVRKFLKRANLLLVIIGIDTPISRHLYEFLQSDVLKSQSEQRIVIVLNKMDLWDGIPAAHRERELSRYADFLIRGDKKLGFPGIGRLFDYEIPIVPFSVFNTRRKLERESLVELKHSIADSLQGSNDGHVLRAAREMLGVMSKYEYLRNAYRVSVDSAKLAQKIKKKTSRKLKKLFEEEVELFVTTVVELDQASWEEMNSLPPPGVLEKFFSTGGLDRKKTELRAVREKYDNRLKAAFDRFANNLVNSAARLLSSNTGGEFKLKRPSPDEVYEALASMNYVNWDVHDDVHYRDVSVSSTSVKDRTLEKRTNVLEALGEWTDSLNLEGALGRASSKSSRRQRGTVEALQEFVDCLELAEKSLSALAQHSESEVWES